MRCLKDEEIDYLQKQIQMLHSELCSIQTSFLTMISVAVEYKDRSS